MEQTRIESAIEVFFNYLNQQSVEGDMTNKDLAGNNYVKSETTGAGVMSDVDIWIMCGNSNATIPLGHGLVRWLVKDDYTPTRVVKYEDYATLQAELDAANAENVLFDSKIGWLKDELQAANRDKRNLLDNDAVAKTAIEIQKELQAERVKVKRYRKALGWVAKKSLYHPQQGNAIRNLAQQALSDNEVKDE